MEWHHP